MGTPLQAEATADCEGDMHMHSAHLGQWIEAPSWRSRAAQASSPACLAAVWRCPDPCHIHKQPAAGSSAALREACDHCLHPAIAHLLSASVDTTLSSTRSTKLQLPDTCHLMQLPLALLWLGKHMGCGRALVTLGSLQRTHRQHKHCILWDGWSKHVCHVFCTAPCSKLRNVTCFMYEEDLRRNRCSRTGSSSWRPLISCTTMNDNYMCQLPAKGVCNRNLMLAYTDHCNQCRLNMLDAMETLSCCKMWICHLSA